jgi:hypothetical protein
MKQRTGCSSTRPSTDLAAVGAQACPSSTSKTLAEIAEIAETPADADSADVGAAPMPALSG